MNRRAFFARFDDELARARRARTPVTLVLYDLDGFKAINDEHGHPTGDVALRAFAEGLETNLRASDSVGRIGGDEFALILVGADVQHEASILERLSTTLASGGPGTTGVCASFGAARFPEDGATRDEPGGHRRPSPLRAQAPRRQVVASAVPSTRCRLHEVDVGGFVVGDVALARRAPPPRLDGGPAGRVVERRGAARAPVRAPLREQAQRSGQLRAPARCSA